MRSMFLLLLLLPLLLAFAWPAFAVDGVLEINQTCAVETGCFSGDTAGFPVSITQAGSYRLTGSLAIGNTALDGITITADEVTLDLNGFAVTNDVTCDNVGSAVSCTATGTDGQGVDAEGQARLSVRNGSVRGFRSHGIAAGDYAYIAEVRVEQNGGSGIVAGDSASVTRSTTAIHGSDGVVAGISSEVEGVNAHGNRTDGINADFGSVVIGSRALRNGGDGFDLAFGVVLTNSAAYLNEGDGIDARGGCLIRGNAAYSNGATMAGYQLNTQDNTSYLENVFDGATGQLGFVNGGTNTGGNLCDAVLCP